MADSMNPTVVAASLDDKDLQNSINNLVKFVADKTNEMAKSMDTAVDRMTKKLKELGNINGNSNTVNNGGSSRRKKMQDEETQAIKQTTVGYDQLAQAKQKAVETTQAQDSYQTFVKNMRENVALLAKEIKDMPNWSLDRQFGNYMQYERQIEQTRQRIQELKQELQNIGSDPNSSRLVKKQKTEEIVQEQQRLVQLQKEQITTTRQIELADQQALAQKKAQYEIEKKALVDMSVGQREKVTFGEKQVEQETKITEEIRKQAQAIRESKQWKETGGYSYDIGDVTYYVSKKQGEIEEQLVRHKEQQVNYQKDYLTAGMAVEQSTKMQAATEEKLVHAENQRLGIEQQITQEKEKQRKRYTAPTSHEWDYNQSLYNQFVKERLGVKNLVSWDENTSNINRLNAALAQLKNFYSSLTSEERAHPYGQTTLQQIQILERKLNILRSEMSRPLTLNAAMGLPEKTLDDMAYKMRQLASYRSGLNVKTQTEEIDQVNRKYTELQKKMNDVIQKNTALTVSNNALTRSWNYMKNRLAFYFTVGASTAFIKNLIEVRSQYEMSERALGILVDSAERGTQIFSELSEMSLVSPYTLIELSNAARQLTAYDIAAKDVVDTTRRLADMASAVGVPIERLTYALGQIKAYGYLNSRDARMFANAGIPLVKQLADYYSELEGKVVSTADVYDRMKKKAIEYNDVMAVVTKMTDEGGKFFDFQAKMADTLKVRLANLTLAWNNMLNDIGKNNQGILTWTIGALRDLFLHWREFDSAIRKMAWAGGLVIGLRALNVLLVRHGVQWRILSKEMTAAGIAGTKAATRVAAASNLIRSASSTVLKSAITWWSLLALAIVDVFQTWDRNATEINELNKDIANGAKESSDALSEFMSKAEVAQARLSAASNKMTDSEAEKTWELLREQIELSGLSAKSLIPELMTIDDLNKRITKGFELADKIKESNDALSDLYNTIQISQDSVLMGAFGEGLAEDIEDFNDYLHSLESFDKRTKEMSNENANALTRMYTNVVKGIPLIFTTAAHGISELFGSSFKEAEKEAKEFSYEAAHSIKAALGEEGMKDSVKVNEAIQRVLQGIEKKYPQIQGKGKVLFETIFNDIMAEKFEGVVDRMDYYYNIFLEDLKRNHGSAFQSVTDDINKETHIWNSEQLKAINKTAEDIKKRLPQSASDAIDEILQNLNKQEFKVRIVTEFATNSYDDVQKKFREKFIERPLILNPEEREKEETKALQKYGTLMRKNGENNLEYEKRISEEKKKQLEIQKTEQDIIDKNSGKQDDASRIITENAKESLAATTAWLTAADEIEKWGGYDFSVKNSKSGGSKKDVLGESFGKVTQVIENTRKRFKEYRDVGVDAQEALTLATNEYGNTLAQNNAILNKFGIQTKNTDEIMTMDMRNVREYYDTLLDGAKRVGNAKGIEVLEQAIARLNVEISKTDYKKVTEGLNNELGRLKDEYELSIELDADPEMSDMFLNMFDIDGNTLPKTIDDVAERALRMFNEAFSRYHIELPTFNLTDDDLRAYESQVEKGLMSADVFDTIKKKTLELREMRRKEAVDTLKQTEELRYKLADNAEKIVLKEKEVADLQKRLNEETREDRRRLLELQIQDTQREIDELRSGVLQMTETYEALFGGLVERSAYASRRIAQDLKRAYELARNGGRDENGRYTYTDPRSGEQVKLTQHQLGNEMNKVAKEIQKTATVFSKLHEAFTQGEDKETDYVKGLELIGEEAKKAADGVRAVTQIVQDLGGESAEQTVEVMNDLATTMEGLGDAATGVAQIYNGDIIGGVTNVIKGLWSSISSWFDNGDKKITRMIEKSEREVKRLELAYSKLERAAEESFGAGEIAARRAMITNIQLRLEEEKRQLALEESRKGKKKDEDAIIEHQKAVADAEKSLHDAVEGVSEMLLGSNVKGAAEDFVSTWVNAWRGGESTMDALNGKFDDMIDNMVAKSLASKVVAQKLKGVFDVIETFTGQETDAEMLEKLKNAKDIVGNGSFADEINRALTAIYNYLGIPFGSGNLGGLSDLQQGIKGITEDQAGALEAYWNANTQQQYIHTDLLTQIRDMMATYNMDVQLGTMGQILLQLQQSYLAQMAIRGIMEGWTSPSGMSVRVEMVS